MIRKVMRFPGPTALHQRPAALMLFSVVVVYFLVWVALTTSGDDIHAVRLRDSQEGDDEFGSTVLVPTVEVDFEDETDKITVDFESAQSTEFTTLTLFSTSSMPPEVVHMDKHLGDDDASTLPYTFFTTLSTPASAAEKQAGLQKGNAVSGEHKPLIIPANGLPTKTSDEAEPDKDNQKPLSQRIPVASTNESSLKSQSKNKVEPPLKMIGKSEADNKPIPRLPAEGREQGKLDIQQPKQQPPVLRVQQKKPEEKQVLPPPGQPMEAGRPAPKEGLTSNKSDDSNAQHIPRPKGDGSMHFLYIPSDQPSANVKARTEALKRIYNLTKAVMVRSSVPTMNKPEPNCTAYKHIVYVKIPQTGSTMFFDIMRQFAVKYSLIRALPRFRMHFYGDQNIAMVPRPEKIRQRFIRIDRPHQAFDVMYHHMVFDGDVVSRVMPRDTFYVTMLRYPWAQFKSTLNNYKLLQKYAPGNDTLELPQFLENPYKYWRNGSVRTSAFSRNGMMMELGFPDEIEEIRNDDLVIHAYIKYLEQRFGLVMLVEFLDQSLVLLRRMLCWEMEDILYTPMESNNYSFKSNKDQKLISSHQTWSKADYAVYRHFKEKLLGLINKQSDEFHSEVLLFKKALEYVKICGNASNVRILKRKGKSYDPTDVIKCASQ